MDRNTRSLLALGLTVVLTAPLASAQDVVREALGERAEQLAAMELKPFDQSLWSKLSSWANGTPLDAETTRDKVVLIVSYAGWSPVSMRGMRTAQAIAAQRADKDLIVVGIHHQELIGTLAESVDGAGVVFAVAHDRDNSVRRALLIDQDPDFYVVDRAGQLRFADVDLGSVAIAVDRLLAETREQAAALPGKLRDAAAAAEEQSRRTTGLDRRLLEIRNMDVPFEKPKAEEYSKAKWPEHNEERFSARSFQGERLAASFEGLKFLDKTPQFNGKIVVISFWSSSNSASRSALSGLDQLQAKHKDDLVVVGVTGPDDSQDEARIATIAKNQSPHLFHIWDASGGPTEGRLAQLVSLRDVPHVVVISTDGTVRWQGSPHDADFRGAVESCIANDPGVAARKEAKRRMIEQLKAG